MENTLKTIVARVDASKLSSTEKDELFTTIAEGLQATVWPVLIKYMPKEELATLAGDSSKVTVESYATLITNTIKDGEALKEIETLMTDVLGEVDAALKEEGI